MNYTKAINYLETLKKQREYLQDMGDEGIIGSSGAREELELITKKERELINDLVMKQHVTLKGTPRSISHHKPTESNTKDYYITKMPDGKKIKATTYDGLIDKLFQFYTEGISDISLQSIFKAALDEKAITENPKQNTLDKTRADYNRFISNELATRDIRTITEKELKAYIQELVNREHPKKKAFLSFKGVLNLIFNYAFEKRFIAENPLIRIRNAPYMKSCDTSKPKAEDKILSSDEINMLKAEVRHRMTLKKYGDYYINGYAMLFSIETGVRVSELCALKWKDIIENNIWIHSQQLSRKTESGTEYYLVNYTKNEKGESKDGREYPLSITIKRLLAEIKALQDKYGINSEFIFCNKSGEWIKKDAYMTFLRRLCKSKNLKVTNNHAFRMSLNSNVLIPNGISAANRAKLLGHSVSVNENNYSFEQKDYLDDLRAILDSIYDDSFEGTLGEPNNIIPFSTKKAQNA